MRQRERQHEERPRAAGGIPASDQLGSVGDAAARLLAAADAAIDRALSNDSDAFLQANRQQGGQ